jgi:hypothetical protein
MTSLLQRLNQDNVHERESRVERLTPQPSLFPEIKGKRSFSNLRAQSARRKEKDTQDDSEDRLDEPPQLTYSQQSRWSSNAQVISIDRPPSQPLSNRQLIGGPTSGAVEESYHKDPYTGISRRRGSAAGRLQQSITDSPPLQPLSHCGVALLGSSMTVQHYNRSAEEALSVGSIRVVRELVRALKPPLKWHRPSKDPLGLRRSFASDQKYPQLLQNMIVQGLIGVEGNEGSEVTVFCHGEDEATVKKVLPAAVMEYVKIMKPVLHGDRLRVRVVRCVPLCRS